LARLPAYDPAADAAAGPPLPYRWVVLLGIWLMYCTFGMTVVSLAPLVSEITREFDIGHGSMGIVFGAWQLAFILSAVPCGALVDRIGVSRGLLLGAMTIFASGMLRSMSPDYITLLLAVALFGIGGPIISTGAPKVVARWFRGAERGFAMGIYITGPAIGTIIALTSTSSLLMPLLDNDWRRVLQVWALIALIAGAVWYAIAQHPEMMRMEAQAAREPRQSQVQVLRDLLRLPAVQVLLAMSVGIFMLNHGLNNWLPEILRSKGMSAAAAGAWATIPTIIGIAGSLTIPRLAIPRRRFMMLGALFACAMAATLMLHAEPGTVLIAGLMLQGIARSSMMTLSMLTLVEMPDIGERHAATAGGLFFSAAEVGGASGPVILGFIHDASGGFGAALGFLTLITLMLIASAAMLQRIARRPVRVS
jgi:cyanate permease